MSEDFIRDVNIWFKDHYINFGFYPDDFEFNNKIYTWEECIPFVNIEFLRSVNDDSTWS